MDSLNNNQLALYNVGRYFGQNYDDLPVEIKELQNFFINLGFNFEKNAKLNYITTPKFVDENDNEKHDANLQEEVRSFILSHSNEFSKDENALIDVGVYFQKNNMDLPNHPVFKNYLIMFGFNGVVVETIYPKGSR